MRAPFAQHPERVRFYRFIGAGGIAALVNYSSRFVFNLVFSYEWSVVFAYIMGMLTAFPLMRRWVFDATQGGWQTQWGRFLAVNALGVLQTWVISVFLARWLFPRTGFVFYPEATAHFVGLTVPIITNYVGHRSFTFRLSFEGKKKIMKNARIAILLGTYNGALFLKEQLHSISSQTHQNWVLWASDDGSQDNTLSILEETQREWGTDRLQILKGPQKGFARNFLSLVHHSPLQADFYAYCDQDDIWESDKLQNALAQLQPAAIDKPALYGARTRWVNAQNQELGLSVLFEKKPSFQNALVQSLASGNTMVFNHATRKLMCEIPSDFSFASHDWWTYVLVSACDGFLVYDKTPCLRYRQHGQNVVGSNAGFRAKWKRIAQLLAGDFRSWNDSHVHALNTLKKHLPPQNQKLLDEFASLRKAAWWQRLVLFKRTGLYRQTRLGHWGLWFAAFCNKI